MYDVILNELIARRNALDIAINVIKKELGPLPTRPEYGGSDNVPKVMKYLADGKRASTAEIAHALNGTGKNFSAVVYNALQRMRKRGVLEQEDKLWRLITT